MSVAIPAYNDVRFVFTSSCLSYLRYLCLLVYSGIVLYFCFVFVRLVYPMLPVSLDCSFFIASSIFSSVYLKEQIKIFMNSKANKDMHKCKNKQNSVDNRI